MHMGDFQVRFVNWGIFRFLRKRYLGWVAARDPAKRGKKNKMPPRAAQMQNARTVAGIKLFSFILPGRLLDQQ